MHEAVCLWQSCEGVVQAVSHSQAATLNTEATVQIEAAEQRGLREKFRVPDTVCGHN